MGSVCLYTCSYFMVNSADRTLKNAQRLGQNQDANKTGPGRETENERGKGKQKGRQIEVCMWIKSYKLDVYGHRFDFYTTWLNVYLS